jgi:hypothetical protein
MKDAILVLLFFLTFLRNSFGAHHAPTARVSKAFVTSSKPRHEALDDIPILQLSSSLKKIGLIYCDIFLSP